MRGLPSAAVAAAHAAPAIEQASLAEQASTLAEAVAEAHSEPAVELASLAEQASTLAEAAEADAWPFALPRQSSSVHSKRRSARREWYTVARRRRPWLLGAGWPRVLRGVCRLERSAAAASGRSVYQ